MKNTTLARRYAKALYAVASDINTLDDVAQGLNNLSLAIKTLPEFGRLLANPLVKVEAKQGLIKTVTSNKLILRLIALLSKRKRLSMLPWIYDEFLSLSDLAKGIHRAVIKMAIPLEDAQKRAVEAALAKSLGGHVLGQYEIAKNLLGGIWVKLSDRVLDATIKGKIDNFRHTLMHSVN